MYRFVCIVLVVAGAAGLVFWWGLGAHRKPLRAPLTSPDSVDFGAVASFPERAGSGQLRISYLGSEPYSDARRFDHLSVTDGATERHEDLVPQGEMEIDGETFAVVMVRTWSGLLPVTDGTPMANVTVFKDDVPLVENLMLRPATRIDVGDVCSIEMRACGDRTTAMTDFDRSIRQANRGQWGVLYNNRWVHFEGLAPGTGMTFSDGTHISVESYSPEGPTLILRKRSPNGDEFIKVDGPTDGPPVFFDPGETPGAALIVVCDDGRAIIGGFDATELSVGERWPFPGERYSVRLEQALLSAAPVQENDSPFFEAVLESQTRRVRVRQGEAVRVGESLLRYQRAADNATAMIRIRVVRTDVGSVDVALEPDERYFFEWQGDLWSVAHDDVRPGTSITIKPQDDARWPLYASITSLTMGLVMLLPRRAKRGH